MSRMMRRSETQGAELSEAEYPTLRLEPSHRLGPPPAARVRHARRGHRNRRHGNDLRAAVMRSGDTVVFYDNRDELVAAIERDGLFLEGTLGPFYMRPRATANAATLLPSTASLSW
jgi:hypothetical protein